MNTNTSFIRLNEMGNPGIDSSMCKDTEAWNDILCLGNYKPFDVGGTRNVRGGMRRYFVGEATDTHVTEMCIFVCRWLCVSTVFPKYINQPVAEKTVAHIFITWFYFCLNASQKIPQFSAHIRSISLLRSHLLLTSLHLLSCSFSPCVVSSHIDLSLSTVS